MLSSDSAASLSLQIERLREESQRRIQEQTELLRQQMARGGHSQTPLAVSLERVCGAIYNTVNLHLILSVCVQDLQLRKMKMKMKCPH